MRDIILAEIISPTGLLPISRSELNMISSFCAAAELSQQTYLEEIPPNLKKTNAYKTHIDASGRDIILTKVFFDTGMIKSMFANWRVSGLPLSEYLRDHLDRFINKNPHFKELKQEKTNMLNILNMYGFRLSTDYQQPLYDLNSNDDEPPYLLPSEMGDLLKVAPVDPNNEYGGTKDDEKAKQIKEGIKKLSELFNAGKIKIGDEIKLNGKKIKFNGFDRSGNPILEELVESSPDFPPLAETERQRLKLEKLELRAYPQADALINQIINKTIDIAKPEGREKFVKDWEAQCPGLPIPCVPAKNDYWYLEQLANGKIVSSLTDNSKKAIPRFSQDEILYFDNSFTEEYYNTPDPADPTKKKMQTVISPLLQEFLGSQQVGVVNIKRQDIDAALWDGDPANRKPTAKHQQILTSLGLDTTKFEFRCIRQDEYARASISQNWGQKKLVINFDHYFEGADRYGLYGGYRDDGGPSFVSRDSRVYGYGTLAFRLVLARKQI